MQYLRRIDRSLRKKEGHQKTELLTAQQQAACIVSINHRINNAAECSGLFLLFL